MNCEAWMPRAKTTCAMPEGHAGGHRTLEGKIGYHVAQRNYDRTEKRLIKQRRYDESEKGKATYRRRVESGHHAESSARYCRRKADERDALQLEELIRA